MEVFVSTGHREGLLPFGVQQVAGRRCRFLDGVFSHREDAFGLNSARFIRSKLTDNCAGRIDLPVHLHRACTAVDDLELCASKGGFTLGILTGGSIILLHRNRAKQTFIDRLVHAPIAVSHLLEQRHGSICPDVLCATGRRTVSNDGTEQCVGDHGITKGILHFRDLQTTKGQLIDTCGRYIQRIAGVTVRQVILAVKASAVAICSKVPGTGSCATPFFIGVELPLKDSPLEGAVALGSGGVLIHLCQNKGRVKDRNIGYRDDIITVFYGEGVCLGIQLVALGCFGFLNCQHIANVIVLTGLCVAVGIGLEGFHYLAVQGNGVLGTRQGVQRIVLDLIDTTCGSVDRLL